MLSDSQPWVIRPSAVVMPEGGPARVPPRPIDKQEPGYLGKYDATTLFYDVFRMGSEVLALGPPAGSLQPVVDEVRLVDPHHTISQAFSTDAGLDRVGRFWSRAPRDQAALYVTTPVLNDPIPVSGDLARHFAGRRAMMTLSKNNPLEWIGTWARWYVDRHGVDAIVFYDNGSTAYTPSDVWQTLRAVPGIEVAAVVEWNFRYGPLGTNQWRLWDSNYTQHGALEHARWRMLRDAAGFLNVDIDELVIDVDGRSVFVEVARSAGLGLQIAGTWVYPDPQAPAGLPKHADAYWVLPGDRASPPKWIVVPRRLPRKAQLGIHNFNRGGYLLEAKHLRFGHLLNISTNWNGGRDSFNVDTTRYRIDTELLSRLRGEAPPARQERAPLKDAGIRAINGCLRFVNRARGFVLRRVANLFRRSDSGAPESRG